MQRKIFIGGGILGILLIAFFYKDILNLLNKNEARFKAIPVESGFFIDIKGLKTIDSLFHNSKLDQGIEGLSFFENAKSIMPVFKALEPRGYSFMSDFLNNNFVIAYTLIRPGESEMICILEMNNGTASLMAELLDKQNGRSLTYETRDVRGTNVWDIKFNVNLSSWSVSCYKNLCIISRSSSLVEQSIVQLKGAKSISGDGSFLVAEPKNKNIYFHLYFNLSRLSDFAQGYASSGAQSYFNSLSRFNDWTALEFTPDKTNGIKITGIATTNTSQLRFANDYTSSKPVKSYPLAGKPDNTAFLLSTLIDSSPDAVSGSERPNLLFKDADFNKYVLPWFKDEVTYVLTEPVGGNFELPSLAFIKTRDASLSLHLLRDISIKANDSLIRFPLHYKEFEINQIEKEGFIGKIVPNAFSQFVKPYYAAAGDYIVFSNSLTQLKLYLERFKDRKTLENVEVPGIKTSSFSSGTITTYFNLELLVDLFISNTSEDSRAFVQEEYKTIRSFSPIYLEFKPAGSNTFDITGYASLQKGTAGITSKYLWKTEIDTTFLAPPQIILNKNGSEKRIVVQDARNVLYVLDRGGDIIWRKQLEGPVMGDITNIDYYKNEELQMAFATNKKIYVLNDDGTNLATFPLTLPCIAVTPLSIIDMDNNRDYKFFITCENGYIYGFEKGGRSMPGWNPNQEGKDVSMPVSFFRYRDKEFFMTITNSGALNFYTRLGKEAYKSLIVRPTFSEVFMVDGNKGFSNVSNDGTLYRLGYDGKIKMINSPNDDVTNAILEDIDNKPGLETIVLTPEGVNAYSNDTALLFHVDLKIKSGAILFHPVKHAKENYIGVKDENNIYIISSSGNLLSTVPKKGMSIFREAELFNNSQKAIIGMLDENTVIAYLLQ